MASLYIYRNQYVISYSYKGKRKKLYTKLDTSTENLRKAKKIKSEIELKLENSSNKNINNSVNIISESMITLGQSVNKFMEERLSYKSEVHKKNFGISMRHLYEIVDKDTKISDITSREIALFISKQQPRVANATLHTYIRYLKSLFNYLVDEDLIIKSPVKRKLVPKRERKNVIIFNNIDLCDILDVAKERDVNLFNYLNLLLLTGFRPSDLLGLKISDFDFEKNIINLNISKTSKGIKFPIYIELKNFLESNMSEYFQKDKESLLF